MGRQDSAIEELKRAQALDPLSLVIAGGSGRYGKQYDLMIENNRKKLELDPNFPGAYAGLGRAYALKGMYREAIAAYQKARDLSGEAPNVLSELGYTYGICDKRAEALRILGELQGLSKHKYVSPYYIAKIYVGLGEKDLAFDWLQKAVTDHSIPLPGLKTAEELASLRIDPRYAELLNQKRNFSWIRIERMPPSVNFGFKNCPGGEFTTSRLGACTNCRWLKTLKASQRNSKPFFPATAKFFARATSQLLVPPAKNVFRPTVRLLGRPWPSMK
jgi:tetratricopeptide (TPR) repeat protein